MSKRSVPLWVTVASSGVALVIGVAAGSGGKKDDKSAASVAVTVTAPPSAAAERATATVTVTAGGTEAVKAAPVTVTSTAAAPSSAPPAAAAGFGDGTYIVGTDIKPGLYKTTGPAASVIPNCYWERERDLEGGLNSIIANDNAKGQTTVKIASTDKAFKTSGCNQWVKIG
ncbi:MAG: hypothetical protein HOV83_41575 [Catenulispora sp.]|nr:hypothetical protein [Catenulispora sp.]